MDIELLRTVRQNVIAALFLDDLLWEVLVLKGGNALELVHGVSDRVTVDVDFSIPAEFEDVEAIAQRIELRLKDRFAGIGYHVFDFRFESLPPTPADTVWGGYLAEFKLADHDAFASTGGDLTKLRNQALIVGPRQLKRFKIEISKHEYCERKEATMLEDVEIFVYPPVMIAAEKLRAICQQHPDYPLRAYSASRARDFYDLDALQRTFDVQLEADTSLVVAVFQAKKVELELLGRLGEQRATHAESWPGVVDSLSAPPPHDFDYYFDRAVELAERVLRSLESDGHV